MEMPRVRKALRSQSSAQLYPRGDANKNNGLRVFVALFYFRAKLVPNSCSECLTRNDIAC
jgi:hypothetical protein